jgi:hypothetical protein
MWINILSASDALPASALPALATTSGQVPVYSTADQKEIGRALRYEVRNDVDLWAEVEICEGATKFARAAGVLKKSDDPGSFALVFVLATNLTREQLRNLNPSQGN